MQADEEPKLDDLYHKDDKRNPGEQGFFSANPTASMNTNPGSGGRSRGRLVVYARSAVAPPMRKNARLACQVQRPRHLTAALRQVSLRTSFA